MWDILNILCADNCKLASNAYSVRINRRSPFTLVKACLATVTCLAARTHRMPTFAVTLTSIILRASTTGIARYSCKTLITTSELRASRLGSGNPRRRGVVALFTVLIFIGMAAAAKSVFRDGVAAAGIELLHLATRHVAWMDSGWKLGECCEGGVHAGREGLQHRPGCGKVTQSGGCATTQGP